MQLSRKDKIQRQEPLTIKLALVATLSDTRTDTKTGVSDQIETPITELSLGILHPDLADVNLIATKQVASEIDKTLQS